MTRIQNIVIATLRALPHVTINTAAAITYEYCRRDVTGHVTGCAFDNMEPCEATRYGLGGDRFRDPFLNYIANAYEPKHPDLQREKFPERAIVDAVKLTTLPSRSAHDDDIL
jgi:hypothetical protein